MGCTYGIDQLKLEKKYLETNMKIEIANLEKRENILFDSVGRLKAECHELELKKEELDASFKTLQVNFD